jgi:hypothetical protein
VTFFAEPREAEEFAEQIDLALGGFEEPRSGGFASDFGGRKPLVIRIEDKNTRNSLDNLSRGAIDRVKASEQQER